MKTNIIHIVPDRLYNPLEPLAVGKLSSAVIFLFTSSFAFAAVPLRWSVETSRAQPAQFDAYHGETLALEASLQSYGKPLATTNSPALYWQTNGMADVWWSAPAAASNNVVRADFTPLMDPGAPVVRGFLGVPGEIYRAEFQLRFRPSPGFVPNELPFPPRVIDFAQVAVTNAPYYAKPEADLLLAGKRSLADLTVYRERATAFGDWTITPHEITDLDSGTVYLAEDLTVTPSEYNGEWLLVCNGETIGSGYEYDIYDGVAVAIAFQPYFWSDTYEIVAVREPTATEVVPTEGVFVTSANVESEVARQLDGVDQVRSRRILRADGPYEYGNGWGVMIYDFTSDRRWWEITAPTISQSVSAPSPLSNLSPGAHVTRTLVRTDGAAAPDRCASATWRVGVLGLDDGSYGLDITATTTNGSVSIVSASGGGIGAKIAYGNTGYYQQHYIFRNFRVSQAAGSTVSGLYDYEAKPPSSYNYTTYSNQTWSVTLSPGSYSTTTNEYLRVINTIDHHRYYDPGLGCTWEISVTNGCFFAEQVSTNNLLQGGVR